MKIFGDFFNTRDVSELESLLIGVPHEQEQIKNLLTSIALEEYMANVTVEEFVEGMF